jgi:cytochrome oxidase Cu insertion factor (SCO1/SenC/PrrC family)
MSLRAFVGRTVRARCIVLVSIVAAASLGACGNDQGTAEPAATAGAGAPAPSVALPATDGTTVDLAEFRGKRNVLLYFYEHAG